MRIQKNRLGVRTVNLKRRHRLFKNSANDDDVDGSGGSSSRISCKFNIGLHTLILIKNRFQLHALKLILVIIRFFIVFGCLPE